MNDMKNINVICCSLFLTFFLFFCDSSKADHPREKDGVSENKKDKKGKNKKEEAPSTAVAVAKKWDLPNILQEISGLAYLGNNRFACVQDEAGMIFIYNTATNKIERQVTFGPTGDYEGLAVVGKKAYVARSDGKIFEVEDIGVASPEVQTYATALTANNNVEGLTYDPRQNRLLLAIKGAEAGNQNYKGIYAFDLKTKKLAASPVLKINLADPLLAPARGKNPQNAIQPSEIGLHPVTGDIYLTEATNPQLLVLNPDGTIRSRHKLNSRTFGQPEGITFGPKGELYISNEGKSGRGNILQVNIR
jgi:SdiA-regulated